MDVPDVINAPPHSGGDRKAMVISVAVIVLIAAVIVFAYLRFATQTAEPILPDLSTQEKESADASLGGEIYGEASNPVKGRIPDAGSPAANPIEGAYQNPFE